MLFLNFFIDPCSQYRQSVLGQQDKINFQSLMLLKTDIKVKDYDATCGPDAPQTINCCSCSLGGLEQNALLWKYIQT